MKQKAGGNTEYRARLSFVWNYEKDEAWLTDLSAQGLHLVKPGLLRNQFEKDAGKRYVYKMDYHQLKTREEREAYLLLFEDMGWEHLYSLMGWHYFRKPYAEGKSYDIYTDRTSIITLWKRMQLTLLVAALANLVIIMLNITNMLVSSDNSHVISNTIISVVILQAAVLLLLLYGWIRFQSKIKRLDAGSK